MTRAVEALCGLNEGELNSVNLNYYPRGGGVGFHADDEFLFDGHIDTCLRLFLSHFSDSLCTHCFCGEVSTVMCRSSRFRCVLMAVQAAPEHASSRFANAHF